MSLRLCISFVVLSLLAAVMAQDTSHVPATQQPMMHYEQQPVMGEENAPIRLALFEDFQCVHCKNFSATVLKKLEKNFVAKGDVRIYFYNFPFLGDASTQAALAGECVYLQQPKAFWQFKKALFAEQANLARYSMADFITLAQAQLEEAKQKDVVYCIKERESFAAVSQDIALAQALNLMGTPSVLVNGEQVASPSYRVIARAINKALEGQ